VQIINCEIFLFRKYIKYSGDFSSLYFLGLWAEELYLALVRCPPAIFFASKASKKGFSSKQRSHSTINLFSSFIEK
jgi:hypothetical protein